MVDRKNPLQSILSQRYLIANAQQILYRPGGLDHDLDLFVSPCIRVPTSVGALFSPPASAGLQLAAGVAHLVLPMMYGLRAILKALSRHGPVPLAYHHYRCLLCAACYCVLGNKSKHNPLEAPCLLGHQAPAMSIT